MQQFREKNSRFSKNVGTILKHLSVALTLSGWIGGFIACIYYLVTLQLIHPENGFQWSVFFYGMFFLYVPGIITYFVCKFMYAYGTLILNTQITVDQLTKASDNSNNSCP